MTYETIRTFVSWPARAWGRSQARLTLASRSPRLLTDIGFAAEPPAAAATGADPGRRAAETVIAWDRAAMQ